MTCDLPTPHSIPELSATNQSWFLPRVRYCRRLLRAQNFEIFEGIVKETNSDRLSLPRRPSFGRTILWQLQSGDEQQEIISFHTLAIWFASTMVLSVECEPVSDIRGAAGAMRQEGRATREARCLVSV